MADDTTDEFDNPEELREIVQNIQTEIERREAELESLRDELTIYQDQLDSVS